MNVMISLHIPECIGSYGDIGAQVEIVGLGRVQRLALVKLLRNGNLGIILPAMIAQKNGTNKSNKRPGVISIVVISQNQDGNVLA